MKFIQSVIRNLLLVAIVTFSLSAISSQANAATVDDLKKDATQALQILYKNNPVAETISRMQIKSWCSLTSSRQGSSSAEVMAKVL